MALDASAAKMLEILAKAEAKGVPKFHEVSPQQAREMHLRSKELFGSDGPRLERVTDFDIPSSRGHKVPVRLYHPRPAGSESAPAIVFYHGGGWVVGDLESHDGLCRALAHGTDCAVLSVDYRLAPEHRFPAAAEDAYAALEWVRTEGGAHQLDGKRLAVAGDSAGGNLAAAVCQMAKQRGGPVISFQALLYPACDLKMDTASYREFTNHLLTPESMAWFIDHYLGPAGDVEDYRASPLQGEVEGLPPALVLTAGFDPLRDEGRAYAERLAEAGVDTTYRCFDGQLHGFLTLDKVIPEAKVAIAEIVSALKDAMT